MRISTKGRYATRAMVDLALRYGEGPIQVKDIARNQDVSERYLEQLLTPLRIAGLIRVTRGARGGFELSNPPSQIRLIDIIRTVEGSTAPSECVDNASICSNSEYCAAREIWAEIKSATDNVLESTSLQNLLERHKEIRESAGKCQR